MAILKEQKMKNLYLQWVAYKPIVLGIIPSELSQAIDSVLNDEFGEQRFVEGEGNSSLLSDEIIGKQIAAKVKR